MSTTTTLNTFFPIDPRSFRVTPSNAIINQWTLQSYGPCVAARINAQGITVINNIPSATSNAPSASALQAFSQVQQGMALPSFTLTMPALTTSANCMTGTITPTVNTTGGVSWTVAVGNQTFNLTPCQYSDQIMFSDGTSGINLNNGMIAILPAGFTTNPVASTVNVCMNTNTNTGVITPAQQQQVMFFNQNRRGNGASTFNPMATNPFVVTASSTPQSQTYSLTVTPTSGMMMTNSSGLNGVNGLNSSNTLTSTMNPSSTMMNAMTSLGSTLPVTQTVSGFRSASHSARMLPVNSICTCPHCSNYNC